VSGEKLNTELDYEITPEALRDLRQDGSDVVVVDVREPWEIEAASLVNTVNIPMNDIPARFREQLDPQKHIVVVCHHGVRSWNVTAWLRQQGYDKVQSLRGGIDRWARQIDPRIPVY
jgi:rhodanese-related sulfurtransferase